MDTLEHFMGEFAQRSQWILTDYLTGVYLHGSAAMGCFNPQKSDVDFLIVVNTALSVEMKQQYMDMVIEMNGYAPKKGIELSVVKEEVCKPFIYPTPFELHFSNTHLNWYKTNPLEYIDKMNGIDKDLAAHFTIIYHRGKCLYGKAIEDVFEKVDAEYYFDSIWFDIEKAEEEIVTNPTYFVLNLCRVLAYLQDGLILSKKEGGNWGISHIPQKYHDLVSQALNDYLSDRGSKWSAENACEYATYMIGQIKNKKTFSLSR